MLRRNKRILVVHTWGLGDWLFFTPTLRGLNEAWPGAQIDAIVTNPTVCKVAKLYPNVKVVKGGGVGALRACLVALKSWLIPYELLIITAGISSRKSDLVCGLVRSKSKVLLAIENSPRHATHWARYDETKHRVESNLSMLSLLNIPLPINIDPWIPKIVRKHRARGTVVLHPGSDRRSQYKRWPVANFVAVGNAILDRELRVSIILGLDEIELEDDFQPLVARGASIYINPDPINLFSILCEHAVLINSDSGIGHVAAALGCSVISIFGPADPDVARPFSRNASVIRTTQQLNCMPCIRPGGRYGCLERPCLTSVTAEMVMQRMELAIKAGE